MEFAGQLKKIDNYDNAKDTSFDQSIFFKKILQKNKTG